MTNFEKIKNMDIDSLSVKIARAITDCETCPIREFCTLQDNDTTEFDTCSGTWKQWLIKEQPEEVV